mmetsp:Transcript_40918/g.66115  ORF Transcript_40918/g.66115 Transcript_40918/m.66115 type:complete len:198 (-) Transcript_40918:28-621(-)
MGGCRLARAAHARCFAQLWLLVLVLHPCCAADFERLCAEGATEQCPGRQATARLSLLQRGLEHRVGSVASATADESQQQQQQQHQQQQQQQPVEAMAVEPVRPGKPWTRGAPKKITFTSKQSSRLDFADSPLGYAMAQPPSGWLVGLSFGKGRGVVELAFFILALVGVAAAILLCQQPDLKLAGLDGSAEPETEPWD